MHNRWKLRAQVMLASALCFAALASLAAREPAPDQARSCDGPAWTALLSWGSRCR